MERRTFAECLAEAQSKYRNAHAHHGIPMIGTVQTMFNHNQSKQQVHALAVTSEYRQIALSAYQIWTNRSMFNN